MHVEPLPPRPTLASLRIERRCAACGYGALLPTRAGTPCPMCRSTLWVEPRRTA